jgi:hypothetical protein
MATIVYIGNNQEVIFLFGAGVFGFLLFVAMLVMAIEMIRRFIDIS